jgi:hypothetical protein
MNTKRLVLSIIGLAGIGIAVGLMLSQLAAIRIAPTEAVEVTHGQPAYAFEASYLTISFEEMVRTADLIVSGQVAEIGKTKWNQDGGEYWEETYKDEGGETRIGAFPYFEVTLSPEQVVFDPSHAADQPIVVTLIGMSPSDTQAAPDELGLRPGSEIVAFIRHGEVAWWRGQLDYDKVSGSFSIGRKPVLQFMGVPNESYMRLGEDGLFKFATRLDQTEALSLAELTMLVQDVRGNP